MIRTRHRTLLLPLAALAAAALTAGNAWARAEPADDTKRMVELLGKIEQHLTDQRAATNILLDIVQKDIKDLRNEVARLQHELNDLRNRPAGPATSSSYYGGTATPYGGTPSASLSVGPPAPAVPAGPTSHVRLINTYLTDMSAFINGTLISIPPGQEVPVTVPAGVMTFQVTQVPGPPQTRTLAPNETLTLRLFPR
jgi:hypothetical protein